MSGQRTGVVKGGRKGLPQSAFHMETEYSVQAETIRQRRKSQNSFSKNSQTCSPNSSFASPSGPPSPSLRTSTPLTSASSGDWRRNFDTGCSPSSPRPSSSEWSLGYDSGYCGRDDSKHRNKQHYPTKEEPSLFVLLLRKLKGKPSFIESKASRWRKVNSQQILGCLVIGIATACVFFSALIIYNHLNASSLHLAYSNGKYRSFHHGADKSRSDSEWVSTESTTRFVDTLDAFEREFYEDPSAPQNIMDVDVPDVDLGIIDLGPEAGKNGEIKDTIKENEDLIDNTNIKTDDDLTSNLRVRSLEAELDRNMNELKVVTLEQESLRNKAELIAKIKSFNIASPLVDKVENKIMNDMDDQNSFANIVASKDVKDEMNLAYTNKENIAMNVKESNMVITESGKTNGRPRKSRKVNPLLRKSKINMSKRRKNEL